MPTTPLPIYKDRGLLVFDVDIQLFVFLLYVAQLSVNSKPTMSTEPRYQSAFLLLLSFFVTTLHPIQCIIVTLSHPFPFHVISTIQELMRELSYPIIMVPRSHVSPIHMWGEVTNPYRISLLKVWDQRNGNPQKLCQL